MSRLSYLVICAVIVVAAAFPSRSAAAIAWSNPSGSTATFDWANGQSQTGLFGSPQVVGDSLVFFPSSFKAESANGTPALTSDRLEFTIYAKPGLMIQQISISEVGNYSILGSGSVDVSGSLNVTNASTLASTGASLITTPSMPVSTTTSANGNWEGAAVSILPGGWSAIHVSFENILNATTSGGSTASIHKTATEALVVTVLIPEPATAGVLLLGAAGLLIRRR